ncbi:esterase/lipase family protein [Microlunatus ginsengisoli]|uniref:Alpha/beta fold hydrolase n=1 Tax=Microlunatus ginsengisoli TaxID=363863 RepID=A0ABP6ZDB7_9ACTN
MLNSAIGGISRVVRRDLPRVASGVAIEAGWIAAHLVMYPGGLLSDPANRSAHGHYNFRGFTPAQRGLVHAGVDAAATPILLVHGIVDNHSIFTVMDRALRRRGFSDVSSFDYGLLTSDVRGAAGDLQQAVEQLCADSGYERIHIIGHSLGGLIARYYIQRMDGHRRVHTCVTLGSPHQGTTLAKIGKVVPLVRQLAPDSDVIAELTLPAPDCSTRFIAFYSDIDHLILPHWSATIVHPDLNATNVAIHGVGHMSMPNNGRIAFQIASALRHLDADGTRVEDASASPPAAPRGATGEC